MELTDLTPHEQQCIDEWIEQVRNPYGGDHEIFGEEDWKSMAIGFLLGCKGISGERAYEIACHMSYHLHIV